MPLSAANFEFVAKLVRDNSGVVFESEKVYFVEAKLGELALAHTGGNVEALLSQLRALPRGPLLNPLVEAMTVNETLFFRDRHPFQALEKLVIPTLLERNKGKKRLRIWSAAASSGQEIYSVAMLLREAFPELGTWDVTLFASDLSEALVERARRGVFQQLEVSRGVPTPLLLKYFELKDGRWELLPVVRNSVKFQKVNLLGPWPPMQWDLILLRYVLVYFDEATRAKIVERMAGTMSAGCYLLLGGTERLHDPKNLFKRVAVDRTFFYVRTDVPI